MKEKNFLWLQNLSAMDVSLDDLYLTIKSGHTINVYQTNPQLTVDQVKLSLESGSISRRLKTKTLKIVKKHTSVNPPSLKKIKQSNSPYLIKQTKSSIIIEPESVLDDDTKENFDFADYGVDIDAVATETRPPVVKNINGTITVGESTKPRSLKAIVSGTQDSGVVEDTKDATDKIIKIENKILNESGEETETEAVQTEKNVIVMQTVDEPKE
ncbi:MAG: hypothetical protein WC523_00670 [Patescibacteria group bacterium]